MVYRLRAGALPFTMLYRLRTDGLPFTIEAQKKQTQITESVS